MCRAQSLALVVFLTAATFTSPIAARRVSGGGRHSYPSSSRSGLSGHSSHSYPASKGLSGSGSHSYPASHGLSGSNNPHQTSHHTYPASSGKPGGHSYPQSPGLSGHGAQGSHVTSHQTVYNPPQQIHYTPVHGSAPAHPYPVYHGTPPVYIHEFRDSGSKFSTILTGLALYNLGRSAIGHHGSSSNVQQRDSSDEKCTLRIEQDRNVERVKIPCYIISTFTDANSVNKALNGSTTTTAPAVVTSTSNSSIQDTTTPSPAVTNSTLVESNTTISNETVTNSTTSSNVTAGLNSTTTADNSTVMAHNISAVLNSTATADNSTVMASNISAVFNSTPTADNSTVPATQNATKTPTLTTTVAQNTSKAVEAVDARQVKGEPLKLSQDARCFVERETKTSSSRKEIECGLLQQYALQSMQKRPRISSSASYRVAQFSLLVISCITLLVVS